MAYLKQPGAQKKRFKMKRFKNNFILRSDKNQINVVLVYVWVNETKQNNTFLLHEHGRIIANFQIKT